MAFVRGDSYMLPCRATLDGSSMPRLGGAAIPLDDALFYTTLRRGANVCLLRMPQYTEALCLWPHPAHGHLVFPMTLLEATRLEDECPDFGTPAGVMGQWRLERKKDGAGTGGLVLSLVRALPLPEFWTLVRTAGVNPEWLAPCFAAYAGTTLEDLAVGCAGDGTHKGDEEAEQKKADEAKEATKATEAKTWTSADDAAVEPAAGATS